MLSIIRGIFTKKKAIKRVDKTTVFSLDDLLNKSLFEGYYSVNWKKEGWIF